MDNEKSEYELLREKNLKEQEALFQSMFNEVEEFNNEFFKEFEETIKKKTPPKVKRKTPKCDRSMRFKVEIPTGKRKSSRIQGKKPKYSFNDIEEIHETTTTVRKLNKVTDLYSEFSFQKKTLKIPSYKYQTTHVKYDIDETPPLIRQPDEITDEEITQILDKVTNKICSKDGTFCHQCKLKSMDTKTICRSGFCVSVRGQFCGPCLQKRYNELVAIALKDPNWKCPPCRQICVCLTCRNGQTDTNEREIDQNNDSIENDANDSDLLEGNICKEQHQLSPGNNLKELKVLIEPLVKQDTEEVNEEQAKEMKDVVKKKTPPKVKRNTLKTDLPTKRRKSPRNASKKPMNGKREIYNNSNDSDIFTEYQNNLKTYTNLRKKNSYEEILDEENLLGYNKKRLTEKARLKQSKITTAFYKQRKTS